MKLPILLAFIGLSTAGATLAAEPIPGCVASRTVPIDSFTQGRLRSLPLNIPVPRSYAPVTDEHEGMYMGYSYWMPKKEMKESQKAHKLPEKTGYMYGKLSTNVAYLPQDDKFTFEDDAAAAQGQTLLEEEQVSVNGHTVNFRVVTLQLDPRQPARKIWQLYVAMNIETNAAYFTYVPPNHDEKIGDCFWHHLKEVVKASPPARAAN